MPAGYRVPATPLRQVASPANESAAELIAHAVKAKGGLQKLRSIQTIKVTAATTFFETVDAPDKPKPIEQTSFIRYPSAFRLDSKMPAGDLVQVFNAGEYWIKDPRGAVSQPEAVGDFVRGTIQRDTIALLIALADGKVHARRLADVFESQHAYHALEVSGAGMRPVTLLIDPASGLVQAQRYAAPAIAGGGTLEEVFSDYRSVDGLQVAFGASVRKDGVPFISRRVLRFEYNIPLDSQLFIKPS